MNAKDIKKFLVYYGIELKNSSVSANVNSPWYYNGRTLQECYKNCSRAKQNAYVDCLDLCRLLNGENFGVSSYNSMMFTCHFTFNFDGKQFYCVITKAHNYAYPIGEKIV